MIDKTIESIFDGFIKLLHTPKMNYSKYDFYIGQRIATIQTTKCIIHNVIIHTVTTNGISGRGNPTMYGLLFKNIIHIEF